MASRNDRQPFNKISITAGALTPPFFDPAVNFGGIGQTIGHEFGHALDDRGSRFDKTGAPAKPVVRSLPPAARVVPWYGPVPERDDAPRPRH